MHHNQSERNVSAHHTRSTPHPITHNIHHNAANARFLDRHGTRWMWQHQETHAIRLLRPGHASVQVQSKCGSNEATAKDHHLMGSHGPQHGLTWTAYSDLCKRSVSSSTRYWSKVEHQDLGGYYKISKHSTTMRLWTYRPFCLSYMQLRNTQDYQDWPGLRTAYRSSPPKRRRRAATSRAVGSGKWWPSQRCFRYPALHRWYDLRRYVRYDLILRRNQSCAAAHRCA